MSATATNHIAVRTGLPFRTTRCLCLRPCEFFIVIALKDVIQAAQKAKMTVTKIAVTPLTHKSDARDKVRATILSVTARHLHVLLDVAIRIKMATSRRIARWPERLLLTRTSARRTAEKPIALFWQCRYDDTVNRKLVFLRTVYIWSSTSLF